MHSKSAFISTVVAVHRHVDPDHSHRRGPRRRWWRWRWRWRAAAAAVAPAAAVSHVPAAVSRSSSSRSSGSRSSYSRSCGIEFHAVVRRQFGDTAPATRPSTGKCPVHPRAMFPGHRRDRLHGPSQLPVDRSIASERRVGCLGSLADAVNESSLGGESAVHGKQCLTTSLRGASRLGCRRTVRPHVPGATSRRAIAAWCGSSRSDRPGLEDRPGSDNSDVGNFLGVGGGAGAAGNRPGQFLQRNRPGTGNLPGVGGGDRGSLGGGDRGNLWRPPSGRAASGTFQLERALAKPQRELEQARGQPQRVHEPAARKRPAAPR